MNFKNNPTMDRGKIVHFRVAFLVGLALLPTFSVFAQASGVEIANSITEFSLTQGQGGWSYGIYNQTTHGAVYHPDLEETRLSNFSSAQVRDAEM